MVAGIFTGVATAVQRVKEELNETWYGVKSTGEFVTKEATKLLLWSVSLMGNTLLNSLFLILDSFGIIDVGHVDFQSVLQIELNGQTQKLGFQYVSENFTLYLGGMKLSFIDLFGSTNMKYETLGISDSSMWFLVLLGELMSMAPLVTSSSLMSNPASTKEAFGILILSIVYNLIFQLPVMSSIVDTSSDFDLVRARTQILDIAYYNFIVALTLIQKEMTALILSKSKLTTLTSISLFAFVDTIKGFFSSFYSIFSGVQIEYTPSFSISFISIIIAILKGMAINQGPSELDDIGNLLTEIIKSLNGVSSSMSSSYIIRFKDTKNM